jgi:hypothetical protein
MLNLLEDNIDAIKKNIETSVYASKEVGLEINVEKIKYMLLSRHQNAVQNRDLKIASRSFENVSVQILGNDSKKSKFCSGRNEEETEFW